MAAERADKSRGSTLVRAVARWVKDWAESVLNEPTVEVPVEDSLSPWERGGVRVVPPSSAQDAGGPPEHWQRLVQSTRRGPPADWVERVRRGAPHLLEGLELEESPPVLPEPPPVAVPPRPVAPVTSSRREPVPAVGKGAAPQARPQVRLSRPSPPGREEPGITRPVRTSEPQTPVSSATAVGHPVPTSAQSTGPRTDEPSSRLTRERGIAAPVPGTVRRDVQEAPREGGSIPTTPRAGTQEGAHFTRARGLSFRPIPETSPSTESQRPEPGFRIRQAGEGNPGPSIPSPRPSPEGRGVIGGRRGGEMGTVMASSHAPGAVPSSATRSSPFPMPEPSFRETARTRETARAEPSSVPGGVSSSDAPYSWPEPPELPSPETGDPLAVLRDWERLRRLEREQRGE